LLKFVITQTGRTCLQHAAYSCSK